MMKTLAKVAAIVALGMSSSVYAQSFKAGFPHGYVGADAMAWRIKVSDVDEKLNSAALRLVAGVKLDDYLAIELHGATGGSDNVGAEKVELDYLIGGFLKGIVPMGNSARLYGLLGYSEVKLSLDSVGSGREDDVSFGAGVEFDVADNLAISGDIIRYLSPSEFDFDTASVGLRYRF